ncbi:MAG TPA: TRAP transporter small permease [Beijerinckiaceae bacterium]|nr:transporter small permease [Microvirga sp.]HZB37480.1 TRAP transporter small permease [Beijerinckiaceae bacterium]
MTAASPLPGHPAAPPLPEHSPIARAARALAIVGGALSIATALLVTSSVTLRWLGYGAINGDFELVQVGVALSVFCFLPLTQASRGNIVVDTFTGWLPTRAQRVIDAFWDFVYAAFMALVAWGLMNGARDAFASHLNSAMLGMPLWPVFAAAVLLVLLLVATAIDTALTLLRERT